MNKDFHRFLSCLGYDEDLSIRTFSDKNRFLKGVVKNGGLIRCNACGKFYKEKDLYLGVKNRPICRTCSPVKLQISRKELPKYMNLLKYKNEHHHGVHVCVNAGHRDTEVEKVYAQFFEMDTISFEEQAKIIKKLEIKPSMIVKTRKSLHVYFLIKEGKTSRFREIQERLAITFNGDTQKRNLSTCMRVPGFYHNKKDPIMVRLLHCDPSLIYTQDEVIKKLALYRLPEKPKRKPFSYDGDKSELVNMVYGHIRDKIVQEGRDKVIMECINPLHEDNNPSSVFFKDSLYFYCSGCGYSHGLKYVAEENRWNDILNYIERGA